MKGLTIGIAVIGCLAVLAGTAFAGKKVATRVTLENPRFGEYEGDVTSRAPCDDERKVAVWHDTNGNGRVDGEPIDFKIGKDETNGRDEYSVQGEQAPAGDNIIAVAKAVKRDGKRCLEGVVVEKAATFELR